MKKKIIESSASKKRKVTVAIIPLMAALLLTVSFVFFRQGIGDPTVFTVNGEPVSKREFLNVMSGLRANVFTYTAQKYGAKDSVDFWTTSFGGEIPLEVLKQRTIEKLTRIKNEQILMEQNGVADDISYAGFIQKLNDENARRRKALRNGEPIYGPQQFDEGSYYDTLHGNRVEELIKRLADGKLKADDNEIRKYYSENKETLFKRISDVMYEKISANTEAAALRIKQEADEGRQFEDIVKLHNSDGQSGIEYSKQPFGESTYKNDTRVYPELASRLMAMKKGEISGVIHESGTFTVVKVLEASPQDYVSLNEVQERINKELIKKKYEELIEKRFHEAKVMVNDDILKKIAD